MKRAAELIFIVPEEREAYLKKYTDPSEKVLEILWKSGIQKLFLRRGRLERVCSYVNAMQGKLL